MGYTHYWSFRKLNENCEYVNCSPNEIPNGAELFKKSVELFKKYLEHAGGYTKYPNYGKDAFKKSVLMVLRGWDGRGEPEITDTRVSFNGNKGRGESCETFFIDLYGHERCFCKTEHMPYDTAVYVCLLCFKHYFEDNIDVDSDGNEKQLSYANEVFNEVLESL